MRKCSSKGIETTDFPTPAGRTGDIGVKSALVFESSTTKRIIIRSRNLSLSASKDEVQFRGVRMVGNRKYFDGMPSKIGDDKSVLRASAAVRLAVR